MYKQIETDKSFWTESGSQEIPIATLADEHGGRCQIAIDDHCYVLFLKRGKPNTKQIMDKFERLIIDEFYTTTPWIFPEAFDVLKNLPMPK